MVNPLSHHMSGSSRKKVNFLNSMYNQPEEVETKSEYPETWIVLIATPSVERGVSACCELRELLGPVVKVIRIDKPSTIRAIRATFDPEVILSDSNSIFQSGSKSEGDTNQALNGLALFLNKKDSTFSKWIREKSHHQSIFSAWETINSK